ncbi:diaminopimelate epimerase, partial [Haloferax larsenii JCM 13917]
MDSRRALLVDAFTTEPLTGNPAGVVPDADGLDAEQMLSLIHI